MADKKISEFTQQVGFESTDSINVVRNGTNYKVPFSAIATSLGTTGSLAPAGTTGVPILLQPTSTINKIRNASSGAGILISVGVDEQMIFSQNITVDSTGETLIVDKNALSPIIKSLVQGPGTTLTTVGNTIVVEATGVQAQNVKIVNSLEDFPAAVAGVITLIDDINYTIAADITSPSRFVFGENNAITANNTFSPTLTYTGTDPMFTAVDVNIDISRMTVSCPLATVHDYSATVIGMRVLINGLVVTSCNKYGTFDDLTVLTIDLSNYTGNDGLTFTGINHWSAVAFNQFGMFTSNAASVAIDLGVSLHRVMEFNNLIVRGVAGAIGIKGAAASANLRAGELAMVQGASFTDIIPLDTITRDDIRWSFETSPPIETSKSDALLTFGGNVTETVIAIINTPVLTNATWVCVKDSKFTCTTGGRATYNGESSETIPISISAGVISAGGGSINVTVYLAVSGVVIPDSGIPLAISGSDAAITPLFWQVSISKDEYFEVFVENNTNTTNIIVQHARMVAN